jgi:hypothetical protein
VTKEQREDYLTRLRSIFWAAIILDEPGPKQHQSLKGRNVITTGSFLKEVNLLKSEEMQRALLCLSTLCLNQKKRDFSAIVPRRPQTT